ncbi:CehA/McbA family metallohydrolase [Paenibacillus solisilvae]|uniref:CehA/McbA family metallohydrolase n=1 Tax=Paenibacillus solisilvae TaxID=2486751 RepID=A0ABW0VY51_9BACL
MENSKAKAVIGTTVGANNRVGALVKNTPVDFVLKDSFHRETLDWSGFLLSDTMHANWQTSATTQNSFNLDTIEVKEGDKVVATGVSQANPNLAAQMTYTLLPESPIMKITIHLENNGTNNYEGFLNYQIDPDEGQQLAYSPGIGWSEVSGGDPAKLFTNKEWTGNYLYDGDKKSDSTVPAHGIAWHETEPTGINAQGYIAGVWFDASVNAGSSRDIVVYHITDYTLGAEGYSAIEGWANAIPDIQDGTLNLAKINGTVYDENGTVVSGVKVIARNIDAQAVNVAVTDNQGNYSMFLPAGTYTLTGNRMAYSDSSNSVEVDNIQEAYNVNLYMEAITVAAGTGKVIPGGFAEGTASDIVMENQKMAMTISKTFNDDQLIDATVGKPIDLAAQGAKDGLDWINLPFVSRTQPAGAQAWNILTVKNQNVEIVANDGSQAIVRATGTVEDTIPFNVVTTYTMKPDENWVFATSAITNPSDQPQTVWVGDAMNIDDSGRGYYVPGTGIVTGLGYFEPSMPWVAAYGNESEAYGLIYEGDFEGFTAYGNSAWIGSQKQVTIPAGETYQLKRYIASPSTEGYENKYDAISDVYEEILHRKTGIASNFQLSPEGIVQAGDQVSAQVSVTNGSEQPIDGVTANLKLSANMSTDQDLKQSFGTIAPNSTVTIEWPLDTLDGGRGTAVVDVTYQDSVISTQTKRIFVEGAGWYTGDNHSHSKWSDGSGTINDNFTSARNKGLDWLTATDHNNVGQQVDVALENRDDFVALWGEEISTPGGHSLAYNISDLIDWNQPAQQYIDDTRASNNNQGLHYIAHPFYPGLEWDNWDVENITGLEIWNGFYPPMHPVNMQAEAKWDELNKQGKHVYGISNSDAHNPGKVGANFIRGYMPELSKENILNVLSNGNYYGTNGPHVTFNINGKMMGEDLGVSEIGENVNLNFSGYSEMGVTKVRLIKNGDVLQEWTPNENDIAEQLSVQAVPGDFFRLELEGNNGQYAFTNPIFIKQMAAEDTTLKQLTLSDGDLSPSFDPSVTDYAANELIRLTVSQ